MLSGLLQSIALSQCAFVYGFIGTECFRSMPVIIYGHDGYKNIVPLG